MPDTFKYHDTINNDPKVWMTGWYRWRENRYELAIIQTTSQNSGMLTLVFIMLSSLVLSILLALVDLRYRTDFAYRIKLSHEKTHTDFLSELKLRESLDSVNLMMQEAVVERSL